MTYEIFERPKTRSRGGPALSITPDGRIVLNSTASHLAKSVGVGAVQFLWDRNKRKIALLAADEGEKDSYKLSFTRADSQASCTARRFLRSIGWKSKRRERLNATWNAERKLLEVSLGDGVKTSLGYVTSSLSDEPLQILFASHSEG
ncbi:MAG TPA: hypothetical protein VGM18_05000 [Candidatus Sulfotelmatobacter sp.]|jgi:hypothetical protein